MIGAEQKQGISLWLGSQSKHLAYTYYNLLSQQIFDESEDPINQHTIFKDLSSKKPRMLIFDTQIDRLKQLRQIDHKKIIKKMQSSSSNYSMGLENYFGNVDMSSMINYSKEYRLGEKKKEKKEELQQWGEFVNWTDNESNYVQVDTNYANMELDLSKQITNEAFVMAYEHHQNYYKSNQENYQNRFRKELEECDYLKYIALTTDEIFSGFTTSLLEYVSDQCPKITKTVLELSVPQKQVEISLPTFSQLYQLSDLYLPISFPKYTPFQLSIPQEYTESCKTRINKNINLAPFLNMFYTPFNMKETNIDHYLSNLVIDNRKMYNAAYTIPIIRQDNELGPKKQENQDKLRHQQGIFPYQIQSRNLWKKLQGQNKEYFMSMSKLTEEQQKKYYLNFTNSSYLSIGPKGTFISQSLIFKGHFNNFQKLIQPKCQNFSLKYLQGIFACGENPRYKYTQPSEYYPHNYLHHYSHENKQIESFPYQAAIFNHESFGDNLRKVVKEKLKRSKIFCEHHSEWKNRALEIADMYQEDANDSEDD